MKIITQQQQKNKCTIIQRKGSHKYIMQGSAVQEINQALPVHESSPKIGL